MTVSKDIEFDHEKLKTLLDGSVAKNARILGISRQHLNNIVNGNKNPSAGLLLKIQLIFGISPQKLLK